MSTKVLEKKIQVNASTAEPESRTIVVPIVVTSNQQATSHRITVDIK